jgi:aminodeoxyfutalosine synthase
MTYLSSDKSIRNKDAFFYFCSMMEHLRKTLSPFILPDKKINEISDKVLAGSRISTAEGLALYRKAPLGVLMLLAEEVCRRHNGSEVYFGRNFHIEPTNICAYHCLFCSYSQRSYEEGAWELGMDEIRGMVMNADPMAVEVHITGGAHPAKGLNYYGDMIRMIKSLRPHIHIKALSAVEIHHLHELSGQSYESVAEILDDELRRKICPEKVNTRGWLDIHETAHRSGIPSNATMLYGHIETYEQRLVHMEHIRRLQDRTSGFQAFIPLKFRNAGNVMSHIPEVTLLEDMRNYAVARIFLDNIPHLKGYWPMLGKDNAQLSLFFGVDDLDGTIQDSTKIYTLAGVDEKPLMTGEEISRLITQAGKIPVERDALYQKIGN